MSHQQEDHVAAGWTDDERGDGRQRWIEVGPLRLKEDDTGATATVQGSKDCWLSATELAALTRHLAGWFAEDPTDSIRYIEARAKFVKTELDKWNDRARIDEEHPPYDDLTRALGDLLARCRELREDIGKFADKAVITVESTLRARDRVADPPSDNEQILTHGVGWTISVVADRLLIRFSCAPDAATLASLRQSFVWGYSFISPSACWSAVDSPAKRQSAETICKAAIVEPSTHENG